MTDAILRIYVSELGLLFGSIYISVLQRFYNMLTCNYWRYFNCWNDKIHFALCNGTNTRKVALCPYLLIKKLKKKPTCLISRYRFCMFCHLKCFDKSTIYGIKYLEMTSIKYLMRITIILLILVHITRENKIIVYFCETVQIFLFL